MSAKSAILQGRTNNFVVCVSDWSGKPTAPHIDYAAVNFLRDCLATLAMTVDVRGKRPRHLPALRVALFKGGKKKLRFWCINYFLSLAIPEKNTGHAQ
ncbi:MAG: hypothetical protein HY841_10215 [Bacteroidetes bacterium]|nr:hypothetical protein [Bacteroidota bacterium]